MKNTITLTLIFFISVLSFGQTIFKDSIAPKIEIKNWINNPNGIPVLKGRPIVLEFWATWCGPCVEAIPHFNQLTEKYKNQITFIAVSSFDKKNTIEKFLLKKNIKSFIAIDDNKFLSNAFKVQNIPVTIIIDRNGKLRWRGITTELNEDVLNKFLKEDKFNEVSQKGVIFNSFFPLPNNKNSKYQLLFEFGDATLGKSVNYDFENEFLLKLENYPVSKLLETLSDWFNLKDNWKFIGNDANRGTINLTIKSDTKIGIDSDRNNLIKEAILKMPKIFDFTIKEHEEIQTFWYTVPDEKKLEQYLSKVQKADLKMVKKTVEFTKYENMFFEYLAYILSLNTKQQVKFEPFEKTDFYDLNIPNSNNIQEVKKYLLENYGIDLIKKSEKIKIKTITFN